MAADDMPAGGNDKPSPSLRELLTGGRSSGGMIQMRRQMRRKRRKKDKEGKKYFFPSISALTQSVSGAATVALGVSVMVFASRSIVRTRHESRRFEQMWNARTTVRSLRKIAERGERLPDLVLLRGTLRARGAPVTSLAMESPQLRCFIGDIDQPRNKFLKRFDQTDWGKVQLPENFGEISDIAMAKWEGQEELIKRKVVPSSNLLLTELFITRLGCAATIEKSEYKDSEEIKITRDARQARFNVLHHRRVADGLHIVGEEGEKADLQLPPVLNQRGLANNEIPSLFLSLPDAVSEFKKTWMGNIINADKSLTHASRFLRLDQRSTTDLGSFGDAQSSALDDIGRIVPQGWHWNGKGFYDNRKKPWQSHSGQGVFAWRDFKRKMKEAAAQNARHQEATEETEAGMLALRDSENCFRVSELGISSGAVTVLGKPIRTENGIKIVPPTTRASQRCAVGRTNLDHFATSPQQETEEWEPIFLFRILKGHSIEELTIHRKGALRVYLGFAAMGLATVYFGEEMIRGCFEVTYL